MKIKTGTASLCVRFYISFSTLDRYKNTTKKKKNYSVCHDAWVEIAFLARKQEQKGADLPDPDNKDPELITFLQRFDKLIRNLVFTKRL